MWWGEDDNAWGGFPLGRVGSVDMRVENLQGTCESYLSRKTFNNLFKLAQKQALINCSWKLIKERRLGGQLKIIGRMLGLPTINAKA